VEDLFNEVTRELRKFVNERRLNDANEVESFLKNVLRRVNFLNGEEREKSSQLRKKLVNELERFSKNMLRHGNNSEINIKNLQRNLEHITWLNTKHSLNRKTVKYTVGQKEIFYAYLGNNIGSEQNGTRPVLILQNNIGNAKSTITIAAPVTTHKNGIHYDGLISRYYVNRIKNGKEERKYLGFYEIPLRLKEGRDQLYGFVNIGQIRAIDRKRIEGAKVGEATDECFGQILQAINRNLEV